MQAKYRLMTPGPVPIHPEVLKELAQPAIHHRTPEFEKIFLKVLKQMKQVFCTEEDVFLLTSTGSGAMEAAVVNTLSPGEKTIVIVSGKFGERWAEMCKTFGAETILLNVKWGEAVEVKELEALLKKHPDTKAVFCEACETSTAVLHPIEALSKVIQKYPDTIFCVDAITALGATPIKMDEWGLDVVLAGSQKVFMLPTGLSFISFSKKAWKKVEQSKSPRFYFDIRKEKKANQKGETHFSSAVALIRGLSKVLDLILSEEPQKGLKKQYQKIQALAEATRAGLLSLGFCNYAQSPSPSVSAFVVPQEVDSQKLRKHIEEKFNITVMGGQDQLQGKILRIGHIGYILPEDVLATVEAIGLSLMDFGFSCNVETAKHSVQNVFKKYGQDLFL